MNRMSAFPVFPRVRLAALCLFPLAAWATPPSKAIGSTKEEPEVVCPTPAPNPDLALMRAIIWAFEPAPLEVRSQAIEDLGLLGDARALNPLAQICLDPNPVLAKAAVRAIAAIRHPRAEEILSNVVRHPTVSEQVRLRALELLPYQNTWSSIRFVSLLAQTPNVSTAVGLQARRMADELPRRPGLSLTVGPPRGEPGQAAQGSVPAGSPLPPPPSPEPK